MRLLTQMLGAALLAGFSGAAVAQSAAPAISKLTDPQDDYPDMSPDGQRILFQSNRSGNWQLWMMRRDGGGLTRVSTNGANDRQPAWSPDGKLVAFSSDRGLAGGRRAIFVMEAPGSATAAVARAVTSGAGQDVHPKWLADGKGLVFNRIAADGKQADVFVATIGGPERKIDLGEGMNTYASMDRAGRMLVYRGTTAERGPTGPTENSDIFVAQADGSGKRRLTTDAAFDGWPAISPDGRTIAFASRRGGNRFRLYLMPLEGGEARLVDAPADYHYTQPAWSPDGRSLVVYRWTQDGAGEVGHLVEIKLEAGAPR